MNKITLHNYEEYAVDYMLGNLSDVQTESFLEFISQNPEIADEILLFDNRVIEEEKVTKNKFEHLKQAITTTLINESNFEEYCIAEIEGELDGATLNKLDTFTNETQQRQNTRHTYSYTKLEPETICYPHKSQLLKRRRQLLPAYTWKIGTAISAAIVILMLVVTQPVNQIPVKETAQVDRVEIKQPIKPVEVEDITATENNPMVIEKVTKKTSAIKFAQANNEKQVENNNIIRESIEKFCIEKLSHKRATPHQIDTYIPTLALITPQMRQTETEGSNSKDLKQKAERFILTKVISKGVEQINMLAETEIDYQIQLNDEGNPERVVLSSRLGILDRALPQ